MGKCLVVFTTALFLLALLQTCFAAGGALPSEDPTSESFPPFFSVRRMGEKIRKHEEDIAKLPLRTMYT